jgi:DNA-binding IclR family transcriptional regulator
MLQPASAIRSRIPPTVIIERVCGEFREMPGLVLTAAQACRLWNLEPSTCHATLSQLVEAGLLCRRADDTYSRALNLVVRQRMTNTGVQFIDIEHTLRPAIAER